MRKRIAGLLLLPGAAALGACATAPVDGAPPVAANRPVTCREVLEPPSNVLRRYCMTPAQWADYERALERAADEYMRRVQTQSGVGGY